MKIFYIIGKNPKNIGIFILILLIVILLSLFLYQYFITNIYIKSFTGKWCIDTNLTKRKTSYWKYRSEESLKKMVEVTENNIYEIQPQRIIREFSYNNRKEKKCRDIKIISYSDKLLFIKTKEFADSDLLIVFYKISDHLITATFILPGMDLANSPVYYMKRIDTYH